METIKKEIEFKVMEHKVINGGRDHSYRFFLNGELCDWFILNHENKSCKSDIYLVYLKLLGIKSRCYEDYIRVFGIIPPLTQAEAMLELKKRIVEYNQGWTPDWENHSQTKFQFYYYNSRKCWDIHVTASILKCMENSLYMKDNKMKLTDELVNILNIAYEVK